MFLAQARSESIMMGDGTVASCTPEAVGQAIAWAKLTRQNKVHFCLSNGETWIFYILILEGDRWRYYQSNQSELDIKSLETYDEPLFEIIQVLLEWLSPSGTQFYEFLPF